MIIGITGAAGAGKNTLAEVLGVSTTSFALPMKQGLAAMLGIPVQALEDRDFKEGVIPEIGVSPRYMLQTLGTEWGREMINQNIWVILAMERAKALAGSGHVAITDVRFDNEAAAIVDAGGFVVELVRTNNDAATEHTAHQSEAGVDKKYVSLVIHNDGTIEELQAAAQIVLTHAGLLQ
jgi:hypothetical protein